MSRLRFPGSGDLDDDWEPIPFPQPQEEPKSNGDAVEEVFRAFDEVSRRMEDLARSLGCLGFFDEENDRPRAA